MAEGKRFYLIRGGGAEPQPKEEQVAEEEPDTPGEAEATEEEEISPEAEFEERAVDEAGAGVKFEISAFKQILSNRGFLRLWVAQNISGIGDWVIVGVLLDKVNQSGGATGLAWMMTFRFLPAFLFGLLAGAVVDRLERKTAMVFSDIGRAVLVFSLAFSNTLPLICGLVFGIECFTLVFGPARDSSIPELVKREQVITANSLMSTSTYLTMAIGTMIATVILGLAALVYKAIPLFHFVGEKQFQHQFAFILDAMTFIASGMLIFTIAFPRRHAEKPKISARQVFADMKEGLHFMRRNELTRSILGVMIIGFIGGGSIYILGAPFAQQVLDATGAKFTFILTMLLFGVVAGAALAPWLSNKLREEKWFGRAVIGFGIDMVVFSLVDLYPLSLAVLFFGGTLLGYLIVTAYTMLHHNLDEDVRGRVFAAMQTIMRTCLLVSMGIFALVARLFQYMIPYNPPEVVNGRSVNLGFMTKTFQPAMLAMIVGGLIVIIGGLVSRRTLRHYFKSRAAGITAGGEENSQEVAFADE